MKYPALLQMASAVSRDALFLSGQLVGAFLVGMEDALSRAAR